MNVISLEFNFADFVFVTLLQYTAKMFTWYLISQKQFIREIRKLNPTQNLRLLQLINLYALYAYHWSLIESRWYVFSLCSSAIGRYLGQVSSSRNWASMKEPVGRLY